MSFISKSLSDALLTAARKVQVEIGLLYGESPELNKINASPIQQKTAPLTTGGYIASLPAPVYLYGVWIYSASSTPTITITDDVATNTDLVLSGTGLTANTFYPAININGVKMTKGIFVTLGGTVRYSIIYG